MKRRVSLRVLPPAPPDRAPLDHPLFTAPAGTLDRYVALLEEDQALRSAQYDGASSRPDPARRRLVVSCNTCEHPYCCDQRVTVDLVEALAIYRHAREHAPRELRKAIERGHALRRPPTTLRRRDEAPRNEDAEFFQRHVSCPFLVGRGTGARCAVFAVRPHRCRTHYMAGNPRKCKDELQPSETYEMSPDPGLVDELARLAEDLKFENFVDGVGPTELSEVLALIDELARREHWPAPLELSWGLVGG